MADNKVNGTIKNIVDKPKRIRKRKTNDSTETKKKTKIQDKNNSNKDTSYILYQPTLPTLEPLPSLEPLQILQPLPTLVQPHMVLPTLVPPMAPLQIQTPIALQQLETNHQTYFKYSKYGVVDVLIYRNTYLKDLKNYLDMVDTFTMSSDTFVDAHRHAADLLHPNDYRHELVLYIDYPFSLYVVMQHDDTFKIFKEDGTKYDNTAYKNHIALTTAPVLSYRIDSYKMLNVIHNLFKIEKVAVNGIIQFISKLDTVSKDIFEHMRIKKNDKITYDYLRYIKLSIDDIRKDLPYYPN